MVMVGQWFTKSNGKPVKVKQVEQTEGGIKRLAALIVALGVLASAAAFLLEGRFVSRAEAAQTYMSKTESKVIETKIDALKESIDELVRLHPRGQPAAPAREATP